MSTSVVCSTTSVSQHQNFTELDISVQVLGQGTQKAFRKFSYTIDQTPLFNYAFPSVSFADTNTTVISLFGIHRIQNLGNGFTSGKDHFIFRPNLQHYHWEFSLLQN